MVQDAVTVAMPGEGLQHNLRCFSPSDFRCVRSSWTQGNELLEAVLDGPIVMIKDPRTGKNRVIDPGHIGRQIMAFRNVEAKRVIKVNLGVCAEF